MSFKQIVWKMAKANLQKYIFYYVCNSFAVMFFFIFATIYFNPDVITVKVSESLQFLLTTPRAALIIFIMFFIHYAHHIFIKRRKSEFGLLITLGLSKWDICKIVIAENLVIAIFSIITGIVTGSIFARLFHLLLFHAVGIQSISFYLNSEMFLNTIIVFSLIFVVAVGTSIVFLFKQNILVHLKSDQIKEIAHMKSPLIGSLGVVMLLGSIIALYIMYKDMQSEGYLLLWSILTFFGLYICIHQFTGLLIDLMKRQPNFYYRRIIVLTDLDYKFKQLTSIIMLVTVMIVVTILYSTINLFIYSLIEKDTNQIYSHDIAFVQTENYNHIGSEQVEAIVNQKEHPIERYLQLPAYVHKLQDSYYDSEIFTHFISLDDFNQLTNKKQVLGDDEFLYVINHFDDTDGEEYYQTNGFRFPEQYPFELKDILVGNYLWIVAHDFIVVSTQGLEKLAKELELFEVSLHVIDVKDWKKTSDAVEKLTVAMNEYNATAQTSDDEKSFVYQYGIDSKIEYYEREHYASGFQFYVATVIGVIFFLGSFVLLYLNLFSDVEREREKFTKLYKIGITEEEVKKIISREIAVLFFVPTLIGMGIAYLYVVAMITDVGGVMENPVILLHFLIITCIYLFIQLLFYLYTKKKMFQALMG